jgi:hypothetical protein
MSSCVFDGNTQTSYGIDMENYSVVSVSDTLFKRHTSYGLYGSAGTLTLTGSAFDNDGSGLYLSDVTTTMTDCSIKNSGDIGIYGNNSDLTVDRCVIDRSTGIGLQLETGCNLTLKNSVIRSCGNNGIDLSDNLATTIKNNWIHNNTAKGISFTNQSSVPLVRNNTIYDNHTYGIWSSQQGADPNIINCIISGNDTNDLYRQNGSFNEVNYCLLQHPRSGNITGDPCFMNKSNQDDLHIEGNSVCKNAGNPNISYDSETDIDGESRVAYGRVDIGGDEYYWSKADYNKDGIVDFYDFVVFESKWALQDANISLDNDNDVDMYDLELFCDDWLWKAGWTQGQWMMTMVGGGGADMSAIMGSTSLPETYVSQSQTGDSLMLTDAKSSFAAGPARLRTRIKKFYDIAPNPTSSASLSDMNTSTGETATPSGLENEMIVVEELVDNSQQSMLAGEGETAAVWLVYDGNTEPNYGDEITVFIHSDANLFIMDLIVSVSGDANITSAMNEADCNNFGWENGWDSNPYIDPDGWFEDCYVSLASFFDGVSVNGTVGYFKFRYYSGQVSISITADSIIFDNYYIQPVLFSTEPLIFGQDPNE